MSKEEHSTSTISELFQKYKLFKIPQYQRPYSWEEKQLKQFIEDLNEFSDNDYYFGHFLLEEQQDMGRYAILDGQQRLTTIILFMTACNLFVKNDDLQDRYIIKGENNVLEVLKSDHGFFSSLLVLKKDVNISVSRGSQEKLKDAYFYFLDYIEKLGEEKTNSLIATIEKAKISVGLIKNREIANQVFIFHNARGKGLTKIDKLKSFLIKEIYKNKKENEVGSYITKLDGIYSEIFSKVFSINNKPFAQGEDTILLYFFIIYYDHNYKQGLEIENVEEDFRLGKKYIDTFSNIDNIIHFSEHLLAFYENFINMINEAQTNSKLANILYMNGSSSTYCILIVLYKNLLELTSEEINKAHKIIEITYFRMRYSNIRIHSNDFARLANEVYNRNKTKEDFFKTIEIWLNNSFRGSNDVLLKGFNEIFQDNKVYDFYNNNKHITNFILWKYENYLRCQGSKVNKADKKAELISFKDFAKEKGNFSTLEHIYPQTDNSGKPYIKYKLNKPDQYLKHDIGNLLPMKLHQNISYSNSSPEEKYTSEKTYWVDLVLHDKLKHDIEIRDIWRKDAILKRSEEIKKFICEYFDVDFAKNSDMTYFL